jgi:hypothetical protein
MEFETAITAAIFPTGKFPSATRPSTGLGECKAVWPENGPQFTRTVQKRFNWIHCRLPNDSGAQPRTAREQF